MSCKEWMLMFGAMFSIAAMAGAKVSATVHADEQYVGVKRTGDGHDTDNAGKWKWDMPVGFSRYRFDVGAATPAVYYDAYSPLEGGSRAEVAVVLIHGWGGHVRTLLPTFTKALALRAGSAAATPYVIAPMFPRRETLRSNREPSDGRAVWGDSWANENRHPDRMGSATDDWRGGGDANDTNFSSYDYVDLIFGRLADRRRYPNLKRVVLAGFSAGGQFAGRYAATGKGVVREGVKVDYVAMAPSTEFVFEPDQPWLYGLKGRPRYSAKLTEADIMRNLCSRRVWRGCGSKDVLGRPQTSLDMTPSAVAQGKNRYERYLNFKRYLERYPEWKRQVSFHTFEGVGHKEDICYADPALLDFIFGSSTPAAPDGAERPRSDGRLGTAMRFVDPLIGTEGSGSEYGGMQPYACVPFGSFHAVPMTRTNRIGRLSFNSSDKTLLGIILTRQPAIWMGDWGEVRVEVPPAKIEALDAKPCRTRVTAGGRTYEFTATAHAAWIRGLDEATVATFPESGINTNRMDAKYGYPLPNFGGRWFADKSRSGELKIGLSLISVEQAKANLAKEIGTRTFNEVVAETKAKWEELFSRVEIEAPDDVKTIFYTGLYHTLLYPRQMDEGGRYYSAFDDKIHAGTRYNCYSLWDTYRAEHPWLTLIAPERVDGMMQSLVDMYKEGGWLPKWPNPSYTGIMIGAPAEVVLQEARAKGFTGFDWATAQEAIRKNATVPQEYDTERRWQDRGIFGRAPETRAGLTSYLKRGYVACDETAESVSRTQDFSLADRNRNYTNLWCAAEGMFLPRRADGSFVSRKELKPPYRDYCEQQPETGVWAVPHDPEGLVELMGGKAEAILRLDEFFDTIFFRPDGRGNGSIHGNETSHHCAYLYNRFGAPEKTQQRVRQILTRCYSTSRKGFDGNEDCGQMSAWYILSALGFYPLDPASGEYEIGSPLVESARVGKLQIRVVGYSPERWKVKRVTLNGKPVVGWKFRHEDVRDGGDVVFEMQK